MKGNEMNSRDRLLPYRWVYLVVSAISMLINAGLGSYFFLIGEMDRFLELPTDFKVMLMVLLGASIIIIPASVVLVFLDKPAGAFFTSLSAALIITYIGFFLLVREPEIPFKTVLFYQFSSLILPIITAVLWGVTKRIRKNSRGIVFAKTERDEEKDAPSILN